MVINSNAFPSFSTSGQTSTCIGAFSVVSQCDSIAASFAGCVFAISPPSISPPPSTPIRPMVPMTRAILKDTVKNRSSFFRSRCQALRPMTKKAPTVKAALTVWMIEKIAAGFSRMAPKLVNSARPLRISNPTGCCIHALAVSIQNAEPQVAIAISHITVAWALADSFFQPKIHTPIMVDSRKKNPVASIASSEPKMSPTYSEYRAQFMPN